MTLAGQGSWFSLPVQKPAMLSESSAHPLESRHPFRDDGGELWGWLRRKILSFGTLLQADSDRPTRRRGAVITIGLTIGRFPRDFPTPAPWRPQAQLHGALHVDPPCRTCCKRLIFLWTQHRDLPWEFEISTLLRVGSGSTTSCHVRVINTFLSIMHAGGKNFKHLAG